MSASSIDAKLPDALEAIFANQHHLDTVFLALMPALCEVLHCDRCFLYLRNPQTKMGAIAYCSSADPKWEDLTNSEWLDEGNIAEIDPLMAIAFQTPEPVYVEDIETAGPAIVNLEFEQRVYKHRALIHVPLYWNGLLYGILEPCVFDQTRHWTERDRRIVGLVQERLSALVAQHVQDARR